MLCFVFVEHLADRPQILAEDPTLENREQAYAILGPQILDKVEFLLTLMPDALRPPSGPVPVVKRPTVESEEGPDDVEQESLVAAAKRQKRPPRETADSKADQPGPRPGSMQPPALRRSSSELIGEIPAPPALKRKPSLTIVDAIEVWHQREKIKTKDVSEYYEITRLLTSLLQVPLLFFLCQLYFDACC